LHSLVLASWMRIRAFEVFNQSTVTSVSILNSFTNLCLGHSVF
jgi:hypothetical protein